MEKPQKIFIINDDDISSYVCRSMVTKIMGIDNVEIYKNGKEGLDEIKSILKGGKNLPDMVFLDLNMPEMNGWEFLEQYTNIKNQMKKPPVMIIFSSSILDKDIIRAKNHPQVDGFVNSALSREIIEDIFSRFFPSNEVQV